jgi:hypothetical protein
MELHNGIFFDELIKEEKISYLPPKKFIKGKFKWIIKGIERSENLIINLEILRITKHYIFIYQRSVYYHHKIKQDNNGQYITFNKKNGLFHMGQYTQYFSNDIKFRPSFLLSSEI